MRKKKVSKKREMATKREKKNRGLNRKGKEDEVGGDLRLKGVWVDVRNDQKKKI